MFMLKGVTSGKPEDTPLFMITPEPDMNINLSSHKKDESMIMMLH